jgi:hypothetical protein
MRLSPALPHGSPLEASGARRYGAPTKIERVVPIAPVEIVATNTAPWRTTWAEVEVSAKSAKLDRSALERRLAFE